MSSTTSSPHSRPRPRRPMRDVDIAKVLNYGMYGLDGESGKSGIVTYHGGGLLPAVDCNRLIDINRCIHF